MALLVASSVQAQQLEQIALSASLQPMSCIGAPLQGEVIFLENLTNGNLPDTVYITRALFWWDGGETIPSRFQSFTES